MEIAFVSANKIHIELEKKGDGLIAKVLQQITQKSSKFIATMLVGNNIALVVYSFFMGELIMKYIDMNPFLSLLTQTLISTVIILITAEFLPKTFFRIYADEFLKIFAVPAYFFYFIFYFISSFMTWLSDLFLKIFFGADKKEEQTEFSKEELGTYINEQLEKTGGETIDSEIQIFQNALEFNEVKSREVMIPRTEILAIDIVSPVDDVRNMFIESGYSKIVVYKNSLDNIIGYIHAFDMFKLPKTLHSVLKPVQFIPESMLINDVLNLLTKKKRSIAIVLDEYGGTSGMMTVEDIVEELFGEIEDEHDTVKLLENKINDREFEFSARLEVDYINENYDLDLPEDEAYETLGGMITYHSENIPEVGDVIEVGNFHFQIKSASSTKVDEVYLTVRSQEE